MQNSGVPNTRTTTFSSEFAGRLAKTYRWADDGRLRSLGGFRNYCCKWTEVQPKPDSANVVKHVTTIAGSTPGKIADANNSEVLGLEWALAT